MNKYRTVSILFFCFSIIMVLVMVAHSVLDYRNYVGHPEYSAPYSVYLISNSIIYGIPIIIGLVLSAIFKKK